MDPDTTENKGVLCSAHQKESNSGVDLRGAGRHGLDTHAEVLENSNLTQLMQYREREPEQLGNQRLRE